jgi:2-polyprenyl-3-methyl-5-hydroxy-6-metoxy-1,4-benzoquinol methylase
MNVNELTSDKDSSEIDRVVIEEASPYQRKIYFNRYAFVADKVMRGMKDGFLIDCACGDGAGTAFLKEQFPEWEVVGCDIDKKTIIDAIKVYKNAIYLVRDIIEVDFSLADLVVCMETLEHIDKETMRQALKKISFDLNPGGFVVSSPRLRPRESTVKRPGHINEMYYQEFKYILGEYFPMIEYYSFDRYGNIVNDTPDCNCMLAICTKWPETEIF